jgi:methionine synthase II (cobalamin-independent)
MIRWAVREQAALGLKTVTDGEGYRENMYYFYQKRLDGVSMENMVRQSFGPAGFAIECARVTGEIRNTRCNLAHRWKLARQAAPAAVTVRRRSRGLMSSRASA